MRNKCLLLISHLVCGTLSQHQSCLAQWFYVLCLIWWRILLLFHFLAQYCLCEKTAPDSPPRVPSHSGNKVPGQLWVPPANKMAGSGQRRLSGPWRLHTGSFSLKTNPLPRRAIFMGPQRGRERELRARELEEGHTAVPGPQRDKDDFSNHSKPPPPNPLHMALILQCNCHPCSRLPGVPGVLTLYHPSDPPKTQSSRTSTNSSPILWIRQQLWERKWGGKTASAKCQSQSFSGQSCTEA